LDVFERARENKAMENADQIADHRLQMLVLERRDSRCNMARFYVLAIEPTLFGDRALVREWGRIGSPGRRRLDLYANSKMAAEALEIWLMRKVRRGYRVTTFRDRATRPREDQPVSTFPDDPEGRSEGPKTWPRLTGQIGRSRTAKLAE
jgi:predicted DNA-binding WGR domain protein